MPGSLNRLLEVRRIQEEARRKELEIERERLAELEGRSAAAAAEARRSRREWFMALTGRDGSGPGGGSSDQGSSDKNSSDHSSPDLSSPDLSSPDLSSPDSSSPAQSSSDQGSLDGNSIRESPSAGSPSDGSSSPGYSRASDGSSGGEVPVQPRLEAGERSTRRRIEAEASWELAVWRRAEADAGRPGQEERVERSRESFLDGRRQRRQVESLVEQERGRARDAARRREQEQLDDWYQTRLRLVKRHHDGSGS